jgi:hypothetical protein
VLLVKAHEQLRGGVVVRIEPRAKIGGARKIDRLDITPSA